MTCPKHWVERGLPSAGLGQRFTAADQPNGSEQGGWDACIAIISSLTAANPGSLITLRGNGRHGCPGWSTDEQLEQLRAVWFDAPDLAAQKSVAAQVQARYFENVPFLPLCRMRQPMAFRTEINNVVPAAYPVLWGVRRG